MLKIFSLHLSEMHLYSILEPEQASRAMEVTGPLSLETQRHHLCGLQPAIIYQPMQEPAQWR